MLDLTPFKYSIFLIIGRIGKWIEKIKKKMLAKNNNAVTRETIVKKIYSENGIIELDKYGKLWNIEIISDLEPCVYKCVYACCIDSLVPTQFLYSHL